MKNRITSIYTFDLDEGGKNGAGIDEASIRRELRDTLNLVGLMGIEIVGPDRRAINAVFAGEFTSDQFVLVRTLIEKAIRERRARMNTMRAEAMADSQKEYAMEVLKQTAAIEARWREIDAAIRRLVADAEEIRVTGLEPNSAERRDFEKDRVA